MSEYERYVREQFPRFYALASEVFPIEEDAALAAQAMCIAEFGKWAELRELRL